MTFVLFASLIVSCSKDSSVEEPLDTDAANLETQIPVQQRSTFDRKGGADKLMDYFKSEGIEPNFPLSQDEIDRYLSIAGYNGTMEAQQFNKIGNEIMLAQRYGAKEYIMNHTNYKEYTKNTFISILEKGYIAGLERDPSYQSLPEAEQIALSGANDLVLELKGRGITRDYTGFDHIVTMGGVGAGLGGAIGTGLCGPPCGGVGAVVGGFVGIIVGIFTGPNK